MFCVVIIITSAIYNNKYYSQVFLMFYILAE